MADLISTEQLLENLALSGQRIIDARSSFSLYEENHLPGAQYLHVETLRMTERGVPCKMLPVPMLSIIFGGWASRWTPRSSSIPPTRPTI